ncbi:hypothetical protein [Geminisphaera colitermitum]|uniref:hypothetical protein n=1 Tax=Geminisphaera colitermitum TaxID=1148786 RepID=UPI0009DCE32B|nr:hypothetical protein [Geminisphaera colitermitum]
MFLRRRVSPCFIVLALSVRALFAATAPGAIELAAPGVALRADRWDRITINTPQGDTLLTLNGFALRWRPSLVADGGTLRQLANPDGSPALEITYQFPAPPSSVAAAFPLPKLTGRFTLRPGRVDVVFDATGVPPTVPDSMSEPGAPTVPATLGASTFGRVFGSACEEISMLKLGVWKRHEHGGLPSEYPDGRLIRYRIGGNIVSFAFEGSGDLWRDSRHQTAGLRKVSDDHYAASFAILITPASEDWPPELISARKHGRPVGLKISTTKTWNWWTTATPADPLALDIALANTTSRQTPLPVVVKHWIRDYAGNIVSQASRNLAFAPGVLHRERIPFAPSPASIDPTRDLFFSEVSVIDKTTGKELAFDRLHIALLPSHEFKSTPDDSIVGLSAWWPIPDETQIKRIIQRTGVRWLRHGRSDEFPNVTAILHDNIDWKKDYTPAEREAWIRKEIKRCLDQGNRIWEFSNEINFAGFNIGLADTIKGRERRERLTKYIDWLREIRRIQKELGPPASDIKLLSTGLAGMDVPFIEGLHQLGGWDLLDGIALHPGRGNFAVDYPVYDPPAKIETWDDWRNWKFGAHGSYWNFYGSVITAKALINRYDAQKPVADPTRKTLWLTEVYAPGHPNSWWEDTPRVGGENAILTLALAKAEGVKAAFWYQLYDSVWHNKLGVDPTDREFSFGLIQRNLSFKPSFMGFCTAAEALDQAVFRGWIQFPAASNAKTRGLHFDTPRGPMSILWDRSEGYILTKKSEPFPTPEPWIENWKKTAAVTLPAVGAHVTTRNAIGQTQTLPASGGSTTLKLTGAPTIVYGLDTGKLTLRK